jgi:DNA repair protein RecN (Recombination protein N)
MLELLRIKNLALIEDLEMEFHPGLNVLTGESGAGKSFILRALDFILGGKIPAAMVRPEKDKAVVEALFILNDKELVLRRELIAATGRSRFYLNDSLSSQEKVLSLRPKLLIHTSQHGQQKLLKPAFHTRILDYFLPEQDILAQKDDLLRKLRQVLNEKQDLNTKIERLAAQKEFLEYQKEEITRVNPKPNEEEELLEELARVKSRANLNQDIGHALNILHAPESSLLHNLFELQKIISRLAGIDEEFAGPATDLDGAIAVLQDIDITLKSVPLDAKGTDTEAIEARLYELARLKRKLNKNLDEILAFEQEIEQNLSFLDASSLSLKQLERKEKELAQNLSRIVDSLNEQRDRAAKTLKLALEEELKHLGFSEHIQIQFDLYSEEVYPQIKELRVRLLWVPNPGQPPQPLDKIASGGELSRFLLALVGLQSEKNLPTLLFDEVDAGIGGITLSRAGEKIKKLSQNRQVILITHWPQLACLADKHFQVQKKVIEGNTYTFCQPLNKKARELELNRMAGGNKRWEVGETGS